MAIGFQLHQMLAVFAYYINIYLTKIQCKIIKINSYNNYCERNNMVKIQNIYRISKIKRSSCSIHANSC